MVSMAFPTIFSAESPVLSSSLLDGLVEEDVIDEELDNLAKGLMRALHYEETKGMVSGGVTCRGCAYEHTLRVIGDEVDSWHDVNPEDPSGMIRLLYFIEKVSKEHEGGDPVGGTGEIFWYGAMAEIYGHYGNEPRCLEYVRKLYIDALNRSSVGLVICYKLFQNGMNGGSTDAVIERSEKEMDEFGAALKNKYGGIEKAGLVVARKLERLRFQLDHWEQKECWSAGGKALGVPGLLRNILGEELDKLSQLEKMDLAPQIPEDEDKRFLCNAMNISQRFSENPVSIESCDRCISLYEEYVRGDWESSYLFIELLYMVATFSELEKRGVTAIKRFRKDDDSYPYSLYEGRFNGKRCVIKLAVSDEELNYYLKVKKSEYSPEFYFHLGKLSTGPETPAELKQLWGDVIVIEYVEGCTLREYISECDGRDPHQGDIEVMRKVASTIERFHNDGWIHGDLHPADIIIRSSNGQVCLIGFEWTFNYQEEGPCAEELDDGEGRDDDWAGYAEFVSHILRRDVTVRSLKDFEETILGQLHEQEIAC